MPFDVMDQRRPPPAASSFFSKEICFPTERQVGFWKSESGPDHTGTEGTSLMSSKNTGLPMNSRRLSDQDFGLQSDLCVQPASLFVDGSKVGLNGNHYENSLFSSSLSEIFDKKLRLLSNNTPHGQNDDRVNHGEGEPFESLEEIEAQTIGNLLPDDDDLLSGVLDDLGFVTRRNGGDDIDDDIFYTGGGMELEADANFSCAKTSDFCGTVSNGQQGVLNSFASEHPYGEHPSRTLFVRNINSSVEDSELKVLFEQYGDIRTLYTACKHRGFVMISYYDLRAARNAMRALQNKPLRRRKLDIHFSIPKDNPSEKDINQGTLVVFNLDSSVSNDDIHQIFGVYGEIKEIRETPLKHHHKFIEFYDVRAADAALRALNRSDIAGKKIKLEPSRPGGARRCLMQQFSPELEQEESSGCRHGSPPKNSPSGCYGSITLGTITSNGFENGAFLGLHSAARAPASPLMETAIHGISSSVPHSISSPIRVASVGNHNNLSGNVELSHSLGQMKFGFQCMPNFYPHSHPDYHDSLGHGIPYNSSAMSGMGINSRPAEGIDIHQVGSGAFSNHSFERNEGAFGASGNGSCPLHGHPNVWNNANTYHHHPPGPMMWPNSAVFVNSNSAHPPPQMHGLPGAPSHMLNSVIPLSHHQVGSAPTINPTVWDRRQAYSGDSRDAQAFHPGSLGSMGLTGNSLMHPLELASCNIYPHAGGNCIDPAHAGIPSPHQRGYMFHGRNPMAPPSSFDAPSDRIKNRRSDASANQADNKKQYELDIERIICGEDSRTTLMIKNIPNKYTSKMLLAAIDEHNRGAYDFIYLPIDFKNKCNVGYAFINMTDPKQIIPFYQAFYGKKWEKFNSEKVASLAYARIQGKAALIAHFQNSSLMNEDKRCRPILFHSDGPNAGDQEPFPMGVNIRSRPGRSRTTAGYEESHQGSLSTSPQREEKSSGPGYSSVSIKNSE